MMEHIVWVVPSLHRLQEGIQSQATVVELRPERISQHVLIRIVDVATLVSFARVSAPFHWSNLLNVRGGKDRNDLALGPSQY
jgi:hypothetical protein